MPRSMDKVKVLVEALKNVGRYDLVDDVKDKEHDYKSLRAEATKGRKNLMLHSDKSVCLFRLLKLPTVQSHNNATVLSE